MICDRPPLAGVAIAVGANSQVCKSVMAIDDATVESSNRLGSLVNAAQSWSTTAFAFAGKLSAARFFYDSTAVLFGTTCVAVHLAQL